MTELTGSVPNVPLANFKRTKIIATVGPSTDSYEAIFGLIKAGANGIRLNFSHATPEQADRWIPWIRKASEEYGKPVAIIQDLQGPKIRLGDFDGIYNVQRGQSISFAYKSDFATTGHLPTQYDLSTKVKRGERLYLFDGRVRTVVTSVKDGVVYARADNEGILIKRKGMNLPDTDFGGDIITKKDRTDLVYGSTQDIDYVALSFVQTADDIVNLRKLLDGLGSSAKVIAKIETKAAVENIESIIQEVDAVMIARGDLAVETPAESVPIVQRQIIGLGMRYAKPTIVATQMLISMTEMPEPTRAEVSDIATAVLVGADCVMLSDETASGQYPIVARGLPEERPAEGLKALFRTDGTLDRRRDWSPMLDLLYAAANNGTGRRAALSVPTFGKTGTTQENRDALFIGFAGNLVVGVWVGRDDNKSLGRVSGGTVPAEIWRSFMSSALSVDRSRGPDLPTGFRRIEPQPRRDLQSPLPPEWSNATKPLRDLVKQLEELTGGR